MNKDTLEDLVDNWGLYGVLHVLSQIASEKSDHLLNNWQDAKQANNWEKCASLLSALEFKVSKLLI